MPEPTPHRYTSARLKLNYVDWGNSDAPPLLLIHGRMDHCRNWDWVARQLADKYHVIAPDLRGHGDSEWSIGNAYSMYDYVYDVMELVEQLDLAPLRIIGHSLGGAVATKFAGSWPDQVEKLVTIEGLGSAPEHVAAEAELNAAEHMQKWARKMQLLGARPIREFATQEEVIARMLQANSHLSEERAKHLAVHGSFKNDAGRYQWKYDSHVVGHPVFDISAEQSCELWSNIDCPVLLVWGEESWASDPSRGDYQKLRAFRF